MFKSYKLYDYIEDNSLVTRTDQIKEYLNERLKTVDVNIDEEAITENIKTNVENVINDTLKESLEQNIKDTINDNLGGVDEQLSQINTQLNETKEVIIEKVEEQKEILNNVATKQDVLEATENINNHTSNLFNEIDFHAKFADLNEQIKNLANNNVLKGDDDIINVLSELTEIEKEKFKDGVPSEIDYNNITVGGGTY